MIDQDSLLPGFKTYDIRGKFPTEINEDFAYKLGLTFVAEYNAKRIVVGYDARLSSGSLNRALIEGILSGGVDVISLELSGTEEVYFYTTYLNACGGIMITASHNPMDENGMKLVRRGATPVALESGLRVLSERIMDHCYQKSGKRGSIEYLRDKSAYINKLLSLIDINKIKPLKIVVNAGNGTAGAIIDLLEEQLPLEFIKIHHRPDGSFPNGVPNPLLPEQRVVVTEEILRHKADLGIAWDGDFDRCFLFDHHGEFINSCYLISLIGREMLRREPKEKRKIISDTRVVWATEAMIEEVGGEVIYSKGGHSLMKENMLTYSASYGGESSGHHYFRAFNYCDTGMIPWLLIVQILSEKNRTLASFIDEMKERFPCSDELNFRVKNSDELIDKIDHYFKDQYETRSLIDGLSMTFEEGWRFNLRRSNTEPLIRLNIETKGDKNLLNRKIDFFERFIDSY